MYKNLISIFVPQTGAQTFVRMFESHPDTQYIFPKFRGIDLTALEQSLVIVQHGSRVMAIVDSVVKNLVSFSLKEAVHGVAIKLATRAVVIKTLQVTGSFI